MKKCVIIAIVTIIPALCGACNQATCTATRMAALINKDIRKDDRRPSEYAKSSMQKEGNVIYIGMALKASPLYRRHYWIDPATCTILDVKIDQ